MANQNTILQSTELFEELSDADLMTVVGGSGDKKGINEAVDDLVTLPGGLDDIVDGSQTDVIFRRTGEALIVLGGGK